MKIVMKRSSNRTSGTNHIAFVRSACCEAGRGHKAESRNQTVIERPFEDTPAEYRNEDISLARLQTDTVLPQDRPFATKLDSDQKSTASTQATVCGMIIALLLVTIAAVYLFWAKVTVAWPFSQ